MNNMDILANAFEYIETHLQTEIKTTDVANACYCSKSALEKIFRYVSNIGVHEYVVKRRMMLAARMLALEKHVSMLDIALACGYSTNESFSRAFKSVWNCNPSEFKGKKHFRSCFQGFILQYKMEVYMSMRRHVDISTVKFEGSIMRYKDLFEKLHMAICYNK